jgi:hypothetical protein
MILFDLDGAEHQRGNNVAVRRTRKETDKSLCSDKILGWGEMG